jgi:hypothetical protein
MQQCTPIQQNNKKGKKKTNKKMMLLEESKGQNLHNCAGKRILSDNTTLKIHDKKHINRTSSKCKTCALQKISLRG